MKENFDAAFEAVMTIEGGLVNDPRDTGGLTKYGISQKAYPNLDIAGLTIDEAKKIYRRDYWDKCRCDELPASFDLLVFDTAINMGTPAAIGILQEAVRQKVDGIIGEKTIAAAFAAGNDELRRFFIYRLFKYSEKANYNYYKNGWRNRLLYVSGVI